MVIEEEQVSLDYGRNMLFVLLYLQETVYYDSKERDILMIYFEIMIEWKQFPVLHSILYLENCLEKLNIEKSDFVEEVVLRSLHKVYSDDDIVYDEETKTHMREILDLFEGDNPIRRQEEAKLELADIFESFNVV